jgi:hypothetical protein
MSARQKLNALNFYGCLIVAGIVGLMTRSWTLLLVALAVTLVSSVHAGDIRLRPGPRHSGRRR